MYTEPSTNRASNGQMIYDDVPYKAKIHIDMCISGLVSDSGMVKHSFQQYPEYVKSAMDDLIKARDRLNYIIGDSYGDDTDT